VIGQDCPDQQAEGFQCQPSVSCFDDSLMEDSIRSMDQSDLSLDDLRPCVFVRKVQEEEDQVPLLMALLRTLQRNE
jgi:hypothetical protein